MTEHRGVAGPSLTKMADVAMTGCNFGILVQNRGTQAIVERGYHIVVNDQWPVQYLPAVERIKMLELAGAAALHVFPGANKATDQNDQFSGLFDLTTLPEPIDALVDVSIRWAIAASVVAKTLEDGFKAVQFVRGLFPRFLEPPTPTKPTAPIAFWMMTSNGPQSYTRTLDVTTWQDVAPNYPGNVRAALEGLVAYQPDKSGQIIMLHGDPGAGKTYFLRTLAWEWAKWCTVHYVLDPSELLNGSPAYINELLFARGGPEANYASTSSTEDLLAEDAALAMLENAQEGTNPPVDKRPKLFSGERWRLILMEDTGEMLTSEAGTRNGQGLGRLLNAADGMLGQGSRVLFLITTNEPLEKIHPAISRPGRCLANIKFRPFDAKESSEWLGTHGLPRDAANNKSQTLAELFALSANRKQVVAKKDETTFGFRG